MRCDYVSCSSTEVGYTVEWPPRPQGLDWQWQVPRKTVDFRFEPFHGDLYEIIIKVCNNAVIVMHTWIRKLTTLRSHAPPITRPFQGR